MLKSIEEIKKLFTIEEIKNGQVNIITSKHLLSLPEEKQIEVLTTHLKNLKKDSAKYESPAFEGQHGQSDDIDKMQLQLLIQVIESLLNQI